MKRIGWESSSKSRNLSNCSALRKQAFASEREYCPWAATFSPSRQRAQGVDLKDSYKLHVFGALLTIQNKLGLHARPAAMFVRVANKHRADNWVAKDGQRVNGKSILGLLMLAAGKGTKLMISGVG